MDKPQYTSLQDIVDQLELCEYQTKDSLHDLKMNTAFIALKEEAEKEKILPSEKVKVLQSSISKMIDAIGSISTHNTTKPKIELLSVVNYMIAVLEDKV